MTHTAGTHPKSSTKVTRSSLFERISTKKCALLVNATSTEDSSKNSNLERSWKHFFRCFLPYWFHSLQLPPLRNFLHVEREVTGTSSARRVTGSPPGEAKGRGAFRPLAPPPNKHTPLFWACHTMISEREALFLCEMYSKGAFLERQYRFSANTFRRSIW